MTDHRILTKPSPSFLLSNTVGDLLTDYTRKVLITRSSTLLALWVPSRTRFAYVSHRWKKKVALLPRKRRPTPSMVVHVTFRLRPLIAFPSGLKSEIRNPDGGESSLKMKPREKFAVFDIFPCPVLHAAHLSIFRDGGYFIAHRRRRVFVDILNASSGIRTSRKSCAFLFRHECPERME